jgi:hypothetical protein
MKPSNRHSAALGTLKDQRRRCLTKTAQPSVHSVLFTIPAPGRIIGTKEQAGKLYDFATQLDVQAKADAIGTVTKFGIDKGTWMIELALQPEINIDVGEDFDLLDLNVFDMLDPFISKEALLLGGHVHNLSPATWRIDVKDGSADDEQS